MRLIPLTRHRSAGYGIDQGLTKRWQPMFPERQDGHLNHACGGAPANKPCMRRWVAHAKGVCGIQKRKAKQPIASKVKSQGIKRKALSRISISNNRGNNR